MEKLVLGLKASSANEDGGDTSQNDSLYTCEFCSKKFNSGQAYGGHKRVHSLKKRENNPIDDHEEIARADQNLIVTPHLELTLNNDPYYNYSSSTSLISNAFEAEANKLVTTSPPGALITGENDDLTRLTLGQMGDGTDSLPFKKRRMESSSLILLPDDQEMQNEKTEAVPKEGKGKMPMAVNDAGESNSRNKSFSTYFALGGNNSYHKKEARGEFVKGFSMGSSGYPVTTDHQVALKEDMAAVGIPKQAFAFDLNELPPPESDEDMKGW